MWDDVKMWLYLRLLNSELSGYIPKKEGYGGFYCESEKERKFRNKEYFMKKVQVFGWRLYLVLSPFSLHKFFLKHQPEIHDVVLIQKTITILSSAEKLNYIDHPKIDINKEWNSFHKNYRPDYTDDKDKIALSYEPGNRFISYSGLVNFLYTRHWQLIIIVWAMIIFIFSKLSALIYYIFSNYKHMS